MTLMNAMPCVLDGIGNELNARRHALVTLVILTAYNAEVAADDSTTCCVHTLLAVIMPVNLLTGLHDHAWCCRCC